MNESIRFNLFIREHAEQEDAFQVTIRTINPDQTGLMTHSAVKREDLYSFWMGVNAVARTWIPDGLYLPPPSDSDNSYLLDET